MNYVYNNPHYYQLIELQVQLYLHNAQVQFTGVCGGIYYEGIYMVKVILTEIYMLEHFL